MTETVMLVEPGVLATLPGVMIDYLWKLALSDPYRACEEQEFVLEPAELGGRGIQAIFHLDESRRVFGVEPVSCKLRIRSIGDCYHMMLSA